MHRIIRCIHIGLLFIVMSFMTPSPCYAVDEIGLSGGHGTTSSKWVRLDIASRFEAAELLPKSEIIHYYVSVGAAWWDWNRGSEAIAFGITPLLRIGKPEGGIGSFYIELGIGPYLFSNISGSNRHLSTSFEFGSQAGIAIKLSEQIAVRYTFYHYSNSGIASPNSGINVHMAGISYKF